MFNSETRGWENLTTRATIRRHQNVILQEWTNFLTVVAIMGFEIWHCLAYKNLRDLRKNIMEL